MRRRKNIDFIVWITGIEGELMTTGDGLKTVEASVFLSPNMSFLKRNFEALKVCSWLSSGSGNGVDFGRNAN